ncbi:hypothetical protein D6783_05445 [Candidatus Woesearchaeota archaeon]|nr:MAG: hypothetical protein D6783_05445 [Candidatus Woesearchaeota archaeon]
MNRTRGWLASTKNLPDKTGTPLPRRSRGSRQPKGRRRYALPFHSQPPHYARLLTVPGPFPIKAGLHNAHNAASQTRSQNDKKDTRANPADELTRASPAQRKTASSAFFARAPPPRLEKRQEP